MRIKVLTTFLNGRDKFFADDIRTVEDEAAAQRFIAAGWAVEYGKDPAPVDTPASVDLTVQGASHTIKEKKHG